jgi:hypothetical protein
MKVNMEEHAKCATCFILVSCLAYSLTLKMRATCSSEMLVDLHLATWHYIPEDRTLQNNSSLHLPHCQECRSGNKYKIEHRFESVIKNAASSVVSFTFTM